MSIEKLECTDSKLQSLTKINGIADSISFTKYDSSVTYNKDEFVTGIVEDALVVCKSLIDGNIGKDLTDSTYWEIISLGGGDINDKITNCLLEVPQRIKWELANDVFTLKAGSVAIMPYGTTDLTETLPVGSRFMHDNWKVVDTQWDGSKFFVWITNLEDVTSTRAVTSKYSLYFSVQPSSNSIPQADFGAARSGATDITGSGTFYNTATNYHYYVTSGVGSNICQSFPLGICESTGTNTFNKVNQVFNGIGCIGDAVWVDKGVKGLAPNGRNEDGSLNNIEVTSDALYVRTIATDFSSAQEILFLYDSPEIDDGERTTLQSGARYLEGFLADRPTTVLNTYSWMYYAIDVNKYYFTYGSTTANWTERPFAALSSQYFDKTKITSFNPKQPFRAVDYSEFEELDIDFMIPNYTAEVSVAWATLTSGYTAPAKGIFMMYIYPNSRVDQYLNVNSIQIPIRFNGPQSDADYVSVTVVLDKGDVLKLTGNTTAPRTYEGKFYPYKGA